MSPEKISKRQERRAKMQREQKRQRMIILGLIGLGAVLLVLAIALPQLRSVDDIITVTPAALPQVDGLSAGDPNAPVTIDVFEDFQCSACQFFTESIEPLVIENLVATGKARYVFHNYSFLDGNGAGNNGESDQAANASMCANEQGKFWEMHDLLFQNQGQLAPDKYDGWAKQLGLDVAKFQAARGAEATRSRVEEDVWLGARVAQQGTPTLYVNCRQVVGAQPYDAFQKIVDEQLARAADLRKAGVKVDGAFYDRICEDNVKNPQRG
jgi:protein-disulfide isomerase